MSNTNSPTVRCSRERELPRCIAEGTASKSIFLGKDGHLKKDVYICNIQDRDLCELSRLKPEEFTDHRQMVENVLHPAPRKGYKPDFGSNLDMLKSE